MGFDQLSGEPEDGGFSYLISINPFRLILNPDPPTLDPLSLATSESLPIPHEACSPSSLGPTPPSPLERLLLPLSAQPRPPPQRAMSTLNCAETFMMTRARMSHQPRTRRSIPTAKQTALNPQSPRRSITASPVVSTALDCVSTTPSRPRHQPMQTFPTPNTICARTASSRAACHLATMLPTL